MKICLNKLFFTFFIVALSVKGDFHAEDDSENQRKILYDAEEIIIIKEPESNMLKNISGFSKVAYSEKMEMLDYLITAMIANVELKYDIPVSNERLLKQQLYEFLEEICKVINFHVKFIENFPPEIYYFNREIDPEMKEELAEDLRNIIMDHKDTILEQNEEDWQTFKKLTSMFVAQSGIDIMHFYDKLSAYLFLGEKLKEETSADELESYVQRVNLITSLFETFHHVNKVFSKIKINFYSAFYPTYWTEFIYSLMKNKVDDDTIIDLAKMYSCIVQKDAISVLYLKQSIMSEFNMYGKALTKMMLESIDVFELPSNLIETLNEGAGYLSSISVIVICAILGKLI